MCVIDSFPLALSSRIKHAFVTIPLTIFSVFIALVLISYYWFWRLTNNSSHFDTWCFMTLSSTVNAWNLMFQLWDKYNKKDWLLFLYIFLSLCPKLSLLCKKYVQHIHGLLKMFNNIFLGRSQRASYYHLQGIESQRPGGKHVLIIKLIRKTWNMYV